MTTRWQPGKPLTKDELANVISNSLSRPALLPRELDKLAQDLLRWLRDRAAGRH